jgi:3-methyladenine DNA glycosylase AlkC
MMIGPRLTLLLVSRSSIKFSSALEAWAGPELSKWVIKKNTKKIGKNGEEARIRAQDVHMQANYL